MKLKVEIVHESQRTMALPRCENAERACRLVGRSYLTLQELKTLQLMGMKIMIEEPKTVS